MPLWIYVPHFFVTEFLAHIGQSEFFVLLQSSVSVVLRACLTVPVFAHAPSVCARQNPGDPLAAEAFQELQNAYSVLVDAESRAVYDRYGPEALKRGGGNSGGDPTMDDIFAHFFTFSAGGGAPRNRKRRGEDSVIPYEVTLEDLYNGKTAHFNLERNVICSHCEG